MARSRGPVPPPPVAPPAHGRPAAAPQGYPPSAYPQNGARDDAGYDPYPPEPAFENYSYPQPGSYQQQGNAGHAPAQSYAQPQGYDQPGHPPALGYSPGPAYAPPSSRPGEYHDPYAPPSHADGSYGGDPRYDAPHTGSGGYRQPAEPAAGSYYAPQAQAQAPAYPPEPARYDPPQDPRGGWPPQSLAQQPFTDMRRTVAFEPQSAPAYGEPQQPDLRGSQYDQWPPQTDPRGYDLSQYALAPQAAPGRGEAQPRGWNDDPRGRPPEPIRFDSQIEQGQGQLQPVDNDDELYEDEEPPPPKRRRGLMIVLALVGAIGLGGGLAYGYKMFFAAPPKGATPIVKAPQQPTKTQPADPGGKKFANADSKVMERLPNDGAASSDPAGDDTGGARRVQIIPVTRDGQLAAPPPAASQPLVAPGVVVPGMTVVNGGVRVPTPPPQAEPPPARSAAPVAPLRPQIVARAEPEPEAPPAVSPPPVQRRVPPAPAAQPAPPADIAPPVRSAAAPTSVAPAAVAPKAPPAPSSFVVVLASQKSRMEALSLYADLQQQYGNLLGDKVPDVQEADLSSRNLGTVYRLVVGPPGPRDRALNLCNQLKAAGYQGCWVTSF